MIEPSPFDAATAYVVGRRPSARRHASVSATRRRTTARRGNGSTAQLSPGRSTCTPSARIPTKRGQLYLGTERGVMFSTDDGDDLEAAAAEPADRRRPRPGRQGRRPRRRHARPIDLDPRRPSADPRDDATRSRTAAVHLFAPAGCACGGGSAAATGHTATVDSQSARTARSIYYSLKDKTKGELKIEILDSATRVVRTLSSVPREPDKSSDDEDPEDFKKAALSTERRRPARGVGSALGRRPEDQGRQDRHRRSGQRPARRAGYATRCA